MVRTTADVAEDADLITQVIAGLPTDRRWTRKRRARWLRGMAAAVDLAIERTDSPRATPRKRVPGRCIDCGSKIGPKSTRCQTHHGDFIALGVLVKFANADRQLLARIAAERLTGAKLGEQEGTTRVRGWQRIREAAKREARRQELNI